jgi:hypothetical protein
MTLDYEVSYHVHCDLRLASGRKVSLRTLEQSLTYAGWLEGTPTSQVNDAEVKAALAEASSRPDKIRSHLLPPPRRDFLRTPGDMAGDHPFGPPEWLPMVRCTALFVSLGWASGALRSSAVRLAWFQDEFAMPISDACLQEIASLDWDALVTGLDD